MSERFCAQCSRPLPPGATVCQCGAKAPAGGGKWVIIAAVGCGCALLVAAVAGIVAALVIPNFLDATQRAKQKRTLADLRLLGAALESYHAQEGHYPAGVDAAGVTAELTARGHYQGQAEDGWKRPLRWACFEPVDGGCAAYELASAGRDGVFAYDPGGYEEGSFAPNEYDADLVLANGLFTRWPEGQGRFAAGGG